MVISFEIPGYVLTECVYESATTIVCRGRVENPVRPSEASVILKILKSEYPTLEQITRLKHEYKITQPLDINGIIKAHRLESWHNRLILVCEDIGGQSLRQTLGDVKRFSLVAFLQIAVQLAQAIVSLHHQNIIHKDIKPANIIMNRSTGQVKLTDFSIASQLSQETLSSSNPNQLEGTLKYMSPEQTGRMNRSIDYRSDFYSLGITFYEMLTGQVPFESDDPLALVHCHIARQPVPIQALNPDIPDAIAQIVAKLIAKNAEERYQSAIGLSKDLELCLHQLQTSGEIAPDFVPGRLDVLSQLLIPQKLYGRDRQVELLMQAFDRVSHGASELMLISGYSGVGKSSVVNEVNKPITRQRGYFIAGKFDQFQRNIPYGALIQAFGSLMRQLLSETPKQLQAWKEKLLKSLGNDGQVIVDVIPEVELIIGKQPPVPQIAPVEAQNRFNRVFGEFISVFAQTTHPLVVFLDDLQWADAATLNLMQVLIGDCPALLLIGAYRDNEVSISHPLMHTIDVIKKSQATVNQLTLAPLDQLSVTQFVADTLKQSDVELLAEHLWHKSGGNPFFLSQLLQSLYQENLLQFEFESEKWCWNLSEIQAIGITDKSVVELVVSRLEKLPSSAQEMLKLAACIGDKFSLEVLSIVSQQSPSETAQALYPALQAGFILPLNQAYKMPLVLDTETLQSKIVYRFLHDRVQQAAYSLIQEDQKQITHFHIGQLLLRNASIDNLEANIFNIVNQLNAGANQFEQQNEKNELARYNLIAGKKAKAATAYETAVRYLNLGLDLLDQNSWIEEYDLTLQLHTEALEAEFLSTNLDRAKQLVEISLQQTKTLLDKVKIYEIEIQSYAAQNQMLSAIETALTVLEMLEVPLVDDAPLIPDAEAILDLPEMTDPYKLAAMRILVSVYAPAIVAAPDLLAKLVFTAVNLCLCNGNSAMAAVGYVFYGCVLSIQLGDIEAGYRFGKLSVQLLQKFDARVFECAVHTEFNLLLRHWKEPIRVTIKPVFQSMQTGLEIGDVFYAACCAKDGCTNLFMMGESLGAVEDQQTKIMDLLLKLQQQYAIYYTGIWKQLVLNLMSQSHDPLRLVGESFDEDEMLPRMLSDRTQTLLFAYYLAKAILLYLLEDYSGAITNILSATDYVEASAGLTILPAYNFYYSLILLSGDCSIEQLEIVQLNQEKMQHWAQHAPMNFQHKYDLVEAERHRLSNRPYQAMEYYDRAITGATENGYLHEAAIANELSAKFYRSLNRLRLAQSYMTDAYYGYIEWGAIAKVHQLEANYASLILQNQSDFEPISATKTVVAPPRRSITTTTGEAMLDLATVIKAAQTISEEIVLDRLLKSLLDIILENAAAEKGCIVLEREGQLFVEVAQTSLEAGNCTMESILLQDSKIVPASIIQYVARTQETLVLNNAIEEGIFQSDDYVLRQQPKSILCAPILHQGQFIGIVYLENDLAIGAFTKARLEVLALITTQAAISIRNAQLFTREQENAQKLHQSLQNLQQAQLQLIQNEKMATLGNLVAGVAHEINNPLGFLKGSLTNAEEYVQDLINHLNCYQQCYPDSTSIVQDHAEAIDVDFLLEDLPKMIRSMKGAIDRIKNISTSLRVFSRADTDCKVACNIHDGIDSTLLILKYRLKATDQRPSIDVVQDYGDLPLIECFSGQLNQVFMNLIANAIDAIEDAIDNKSLNPTQTQPQIVVQTEVIDNINAIAIRIRDNGAGMSETTKAKVFDHLFTTKAVGKGTGLGLSIARQIVEEVHQGSLQFVSTVGVGTEFEIRLPV